MIACVLVLCCLLLLLAELRLRGHQRYARLGSRRRAPATRRGSAAPAPAARWRSPGLVVLALGVPLGSLVHWLVVGSSTAFPLGSLASPRHRRTRRRRCGRHGARHPGGVARCPAPGLGQHDPRTQHVLRQRAARHRRRDSHW